MKMNVEGKRGRRSKKIWLDTIKNDMRAAGVCIGDVKIETSGGLGQRWPTLNSLEEGKKEEELILLKSCRFFYHLTFF